MKLGFLLPSLAILAISCTTAYKGGQTPDDVYYSPVRGGNGDNYVESSQKAPSRSYTYEDDYYADRWLRMRIRDPYRWNAFDDYDYNSHYFGYNSTAYSDFNRYWNGYYSWNGYYNPYATRIIMAGPVSQPAVYNKIRTVNANTYSAPKGSGFITATPGGNAKRLSGTTSQGSGGYNNSNGGGQSLGNSLRKALSSGSSNDGNSTGGYSNGNVYTPASGGTPTRTYTPSTNSSSSSSGGSSSSSSSSSGGTVTRPGRGGN